MQTLIVLFDAISNSNLEYVYLSLPPQISETPSEDQVANLNQSFTAFLNSQVETLYDFFVSMNFYGSEKKLGSGPFDSIPEFMKANLQKIKGYETFGLYIYRTLFEYTHLTFI